MGAYAEAVQQRLPPCETLRAPRALVLAMEGITEASLRRAFPHVQDFVRVAAHANGETRVEVVDPGPPPRLRPATLDGLRRAPAPVVLLDALDETSGRLLTQLRRVGCGPLVRRTSRGWELGSLGAAGWRKAWTRVFGRRRDAGPGARAEAALADFVATRAPLALPPLAGRASLDVLLVTGPLSAGGAERQLTLLAIALHESGHRVRVRTTHALAGEGAHQLAALEAAGVDARPAGAHPSDAARARLLALPWNGGVLAALPDAVRDPALDVGGEILAGPPPDVLHGFLDAPNIVVAAAALLVGHPRVVLSIRNLAPPHFPAFHRPWMDAWYRRVAGAPGVRLVANSAAGAADYARWLGGVPRIPVVPNAVPPASPLAPGAVAALRAELGLVPGRPVVLGLGRLAPEKRPDRWLRVVARARRARPALAAVLVGDGPLAADVDAAIAVAAQGGEVRRVGRRADVATFLALADVLLLASDVEGQPNALLEAQAAGCPVVATRVGGVPECVVDGATGLLRDRDDERGLARALVSLLDDADARARLGAAGRAHVAAHFPLAALRDRTLALYRGFDAGAGDAS